MKTSLKLASLAALTAATLALPAAAQDLKGPIKCQPNASAAKCKAKCGAKCAGKCGAKMGVTASKCGAQKCAPKCAPKCGPKCAPAN